MNAVPDGEQTRQTGAVLTALAHALFTGPYALLVTMMAIIVVPLGAMGTHRSWLDRVAVGVLAGYALLLLRYLLIPPGGVFLHEVPIRPCDLAVWMPPALEHPFTVTPAAVGLWLFVPAAALAVLADPVRRGLTIATVFLLPIVCEFLQAVLPQLHRTCSSSDVVTREVGVLVGLLLGTLLSVALWPLSRHRVPPHDDDERPLDDLLDDPEPDPVR